MVDQAADFGKASLVLRIEALLHKRIDKPVGDLGQFLHAIGGGLQSVPACGETDIAHADLQAAERRLRQ